MYFEAGIVSVTYLILTRHLDNSAAVAQLHLPCAELLQNVLSDHASARDDVARLGAVSVFVDRLASCDEHPELIVPLLGCLLNSMISFYPCPMPIALL